MTARSQLFQVLTYRALAIPTKTKLSDLTSQSDRSYRGNRDYENRKGRNQNRIRGRRQIPTNPLLRSQANRKGNGNSPQQDLIFKYGLDFLVERLSGDPKRLALQRRSHPLLFPFCHCFLARCNSWREMHLIVPAQTAALPR